MGDQPKHPQLGRRCVVNALARKYNEGSPARKYEGGRWVEDESKPLTYPVKTCWKTAPIQPRHALYIGYRVVHEGMTRLEYPEDRGNPYPVFERKNSRVVWMFVSHENQNPFYAFPEDVEDFNDGS